MIDTGRLQRAIWLEAKPIDVSTYRVRGGTADHMIEVVDGRCYCDCIDAQVRGDGCKHSLLVRLYAGDKEVVEALRALVPAPDNRSARRRTRPIRSDRSGHRDSEIVLLAVSRSARDVAPGATISDGSRGQSRG